MTPYFMSVASKHGATSYNLYYYYYTPHVAFVLNFDGFQVRASCRERNHFFAFKRAVEISDAYCIENVSSLFENEVYEAEVNSENMDEEHTEEVGVVQDYEFTWWSVLDLHKNATREEVDRAYKRLAKLYHPDMGGSDEMMSILNRARDEYRKQVNGNG